MSIEYDYSTRDENPPIYSFREVIQQTGGLDVNIDVNGSAQPTIFELPVEVFNLSKSYLSFNIGVSADLRAGHRNIMHLAALSPIRQITLETRSGVELVKLDHVNYYTNTVWPLETSLENARSYSHPEDGATSLLMATKPVLGLETFTDTGAPGNDPSADAAYSLEGDNAAQIRATTASHYNRWSISRKRTATDRPVNTPGTELRYFHQTPTPGTLQPATVRTIKLPLKLLYDTLFAVDRSIYFGQPMRMIIQWAGRNQIAYETPNAAVLDVTAGPPVDMAVASQLQVRELRLFLAVDKNTSNTDLIKEQVMSGEGLQLIYPDVHTAVIPANGARQVIEHRINRSHGLTLRKVIHAIYRNDLTHHNTFNHSVTNAVGPTSYYTAVNGSRQQEFDINIANGDDYMIHADLLRKSPCTNQDVYRYNWAHVDDFSYEKPASSAEPQEDSMVMKGFDLTDEKKWEFKAQMNAAQHNHFSFLILTRKLTVRADGILRDQVGPSTF